jgi:CheY-like chemotaxis protein
MNGKMNVLIVDDEPDIRLMMRSLLRGEGWETEVAASGQDALRMMGSVSSFDALVLDYKMPGMTGIELARNLREDGLGPPIIICSAYLNPEIEEEARQLGVPTIAKTDLDRLVDTIRGAAVT